MSRNTLIAGSVVLFHVAGLWALQSGLLRKAAEVVVPVEVLAQIIDPPAPPPPPPPPPPPQRQVTKTPPPPPPRPQAIRESKPVPAPAAPVGVVEPPAPAPPVPAPPAPPPPAPAPKLVQLSEGQVQWVRKPSPIYPSISRKLNETGTVVVAVYFNAAGLVKRAELAKSSGFDRLDRAAIEAIQRAQITTLAGGSDETTRLFNAPISFFLSE
jgi:periplasmic protein TonB